MDIDHGCLDIAVPEEFLEGNNCIFWGKIGNIVEGTYIVLSESLEYNSARSSMIVPSEDLLEAISAHLEKRKGEFRGA